MNDSLWLELGWHSHPQVSVPYVWCFKSLSSKGRSKQRITTLNNSGPKVQECPQALLRSPWSRCLPTQSAHGWTYWAELFQYQEHISLVPVHMWEEMANASLWQHPADSHTGEWQKPHAQPWLTSERFSQEPSWRSNDIFQRRVGHSGDNMEVGKENKTPH